MNLSMPFDKLSQFQIDIIKNGDEPETEVEKDEKKHALVYLEEANAKKQNFLDATMRLFNERVTKEELVNILKDNWFNSYKIRLAVTGKSVKDLAALSQGEP